MELFFGIDVGKYTLDVCVQPFGETFSVTNDKAGLKKFIVRLRSYIGEIKLCICEATGGYERPLVNILRAHNVPCYVAHPNKVKNFARATGRLAKTDKLDAALLSDYALVLKPQPKTSTLSDELIELKELQLRKKQLLDDLTKENNRLDKNVSKHLSRSIKKHTTWLQKEIDTIDALIEEHIISNNTLKKKIELITSIPGVGRTTAVIILTSLPEICCSTKKSIVALAGLAPLNRDSGTKSGKKHIFGGRNNVRTALYMATVASIKWNNLIKVFYQKLRDRGKPVKVAIVAAMHKLLLIIKSVLDRNTKWVENIN